MSLQPIQLDVRVIPPRDKHPTIFRTFDTLASGQSLVLLNDHDPKPLRYQLARRASRQLRVGVRGRGAGAVEGAHQP